MNLRFIRVYALIFTIGAKSEENYKKILADGWIDTLITKLNLTESDDPLIATNLLQICIDFFTSTTKNTKNLKVPAFTLWNSWKEFANKAADVCLRNELVWFPLLFPYTLQVLVLLLRVNILTQSPTDSRDLAFDKKVLTLLENNSDFPDESTLENILTSISIFSCTQETQELFFNSKIFRLHKEALYSNSKLIFLTFVYSLTQILNEYLYFIIFSNHMNMLTPTQC